MTQPISLGLKALIFVTVVCTSTVAARPQVPAQAPAAPQTQAPEPNPDAHYQLGPDSFPREGVAKGEVRGPFTLPSQAYPGTQHTYWVYVPAQYDPSVPASLMIFNDGQAFKNPVEGDLRAPTVLDNLIDRREIPVMLAVFINPGRTPEQPEPTPQEWGDRTTNRPTEYNSLDDRYARVIADELMPALTKEFNIAKDPERRGIGGAPQGLQHLERSGAPRHRRRELWRHRGIHRSLGTPQRVPQGTQPHRQLHQPARRPCLCRHRPEEREETDPDLSAGRPQRQSRHRAERQLRRNS